VNDDRRLAATQEHQQAIASINAMFDRLDDLTAARDRLTGLAPRQPADDPIQDAELLLDHARRLGAALEALRTAALVAAGHRSRADVAADIGTKATALFPRPARPADRPARLTPPPPGPPPSDAVEDQAAS
jgi:hypothetical protein